MKDDIAFTPVERARQDIVDIRDLRKFEAFNRYFVRRLLQKRDAAEKAFKYETMDHERREVARQQMLQLEELLKMMESDESSAKKLVQEPTS